MLVLWFFLAALLLFLLQRGVYTRFWARRLYCTLRFDRSVAVAGDRAALTLCIENRKLLPLPVLRCGFSLQKNFQPLRGGLQHSLDYSFRLAAPARRLVRSRIELPPLERGIYTLGDAALSAQDLLLSRQLQKPVYSPIRMTVTPRQLDARSIELPYRQLLGAVLTRRRTQEDPFEKCGVRPYEIYDSIRQINWKASARTGELKVNRYEYSTDEGLFLIVDTQRGSEAARELLISTASSLAKLFLRRGVSVALCANSRSCCSGRPIRVPLGAGSDHAAVIDDALAQIKLAAGPLAEMNEFLVGLAGPTRPDALCVLLTAEDPAPLAAAFDRLCGAGGGRCLTPGGVGSGGRCFTLLPLPAETERAS